MDAIPDCITLTICRHLVWVELYALRRTCRYFEQTIRMRVPLSRFSTAFEEMQVMCPAGVLLHGSFVLQVMFGGVHCPWRAGDVDGLRQHDSSENWSECTMHTVGFPVNTFNISRAKGRNLAECYDGTTYQYKSIAEFVEREADFAFCKVLTDGKKLRVFDWDAVWSKSCSIEADSFHRLPCYEYGADGQAIVSQLLDRLRKYTERGFIIDHNVPSDPAEREWMNRRILRRRGIELASHSDCAVPARLLAQMLAADREHAIAEDEHTMPERGQKQRHEQARAKQQRAIARRSRRQQLNKDN